jgi:hypothetical protein
MPNSPINGPLSQGLSASRKSTASREKTGRGSISPSIPATRIRAFGTCTTGLRWPLSSIINSIN